MDEALRRLERLAACGGDRERLQLLYQRLRGSALPRLKALTDRYAALPPWPEGSEASSLEGAQRFADELGITLAHAGSDADGLDLLGGFVLDMVLFERGVVLASAAWAVALSATRPMREEFELITEALEYLGWEGVTILQRVVGLGYFEKQEYFGNQNEEPSELVYEVLGACAEGDLNTAGHALSRLETLVRELDGIAELHQREHSGVDVLLCEDPSCLRLRGLLG